MTTNNTPKLTYKNAIKLKNAIDTKSEITDIETTHKDIKIDYITESILLRIGQFDAQFWYISSCEIDVENNVLWIHGLGAPFRMELVE